MSRGPGSARPAAFHTGVSLCLASRSQSAQSRALRAGPGGTVQVEDLPPPTKSDGDLVRRALALYDRIAAESAGITDRAGRWATFQVGHHGRAVSEVAADLGCDWHTVMDAVNWHGRALIDDPNRIGTTTAVGLDEVLFCRDGPFKHRLWSTQIVDVARGQLLDVVRWS